MIDYFTVGNYVADGTVGGLLYVLVSKYGYNERYDIIRRLLIGAVSGLAVYYTGIPDHLTAIGIGYIGIDALEGILKRTQQIK